MRQGDDAWTLVWCLRPYLVSGNPTFERPRMAAARPSGMESAVVAEFKENQMARRSLDMPDPILIAIGVGRAPDVSQVSKVCLI